MVIDTDLRGLRFIPNVQENAPHQIRVSVFRTRPHHEDELVYSESLWWNPGQEIDLTGKINPVEGATYRMNISVDARVY